ncbi:MarR family winged helix-turn-helix transcriptional regulator [Lacticaseibacillus brantae]|uniref:HTH marR-type domain-containing protein n=1 Tax=Lacticaseibacillus brantae DSM 23927 TaxID=1423727 RepID=A0A0R2B7N2_9LACO|nr:MarR family transcriptional regulator [Lacticaseibacillus brantae]KRM72102.1 hypothetical protein FC34_GL001086 [Lacticaseibacillus brantae DSM 23927]
MSEISTNGQLFSQLFLSISQAFMQNRAQDALKLTQLQGFVLRTVNNQPGLTMSQLSSQIGITNSQLTRLIATLESMDLVRREHNPDNRRIVNVQSTPTGLNLIEHNIAAVALRYDGLLQQLSSKEQTTLIESLKTSLTLLEKAGILTTDTTK